MNIDEVAALIDTQEWDYDTKVMMLAIAKAESGLNEHAKGDALSNYKGYWHQLYAPYSSEGYLAFGLFQVFTYWHREKLTRLTGSTDPNAWNAYLMSPENNIDVAAEILGSQGFNAWAVYTAGHHAQFLEEARAAFDRLFERMPASPQAMDREEARTIVRTLHHIIDRLEVFFDLKAPF